MAPWEEIERQSRFKSTKEAPWEEIERQNRFKSTKVAPLEEIELGAVMFRNHAKWFYLITIVGNLFLFWRQPGLLPHYRDMFVLPVRRIP
ncbi:hypothetical protein [Cohnella luojiensis]|uniref:Uncharacterized protein n=1 Tax=Cohnella luojiensis TaxID=652876 RepID=A0A4Y8M860_9BACL|nr:hypothetical protein [Cohnella luojiensis]TFE31538.1 hypothetical protein E2980_00165 [Cohnella luojiensis]